LATTGYVASGASAVGQRSNPSGACALVTTNRYHKEPDGQGDAGRRGATFFRGMFWGSSPLTNKTRSTPAIASARPENRASATRKTNLANKGGMPNGPVSLASLGLAKFCFRMVPQQDSCDWSFSRLFWGGKRHHVCVVPCRATTSSPRKGLASSITHMSNARELGGYGRPLSLTSLFPQASSAIPIALHGNQVSWSGPVASAWCQWYSPVATGIGSRNWGLGEMVR